MSQRVKVRRLTDEEGGKLQRIVRRGGRKTIVSVAPELVLRTAAAC
jgi:hypothetical protein